MRPVAPAPRQPVRQNAGRHGCEIFDLNGLRFRVVNLIGRCTRSSGTLKILYLWQIGCKRGHCGFYLVDFMQATGEKLALGYYLDGRVSALWGTHTHVPTADERVYPKGTGYITDLGMTGPIESVLGVESAVRWNRFWAVCGALPPSDGPYKLQGAILPGYATGLCTAWSRWTFDKEAVV